MNAEELARIEVGFQMIHRLTEQVRFGSNVQLYIVARRPNPVNLVDAQDVSASSRLEQHSLQMRLGRLGITCRNGELSGYAPIAGGQIVAAGVAKPQRVRRVNLLDD
jgi:hypothetical protein